MDEIEKASSVVENLKGRIRKFGWAHIHVSQDILDLLRFAINIVSLSVAFNTKKAKAQRNCPTARSLALA